MMLLTPILLPLLVAAGYGLFGWRRGTAWLGAAAGAGILLFGGVAVTLPVTEWHGWLRVDPLSAFMLVVIGAVSTAALAASPGHLAAERAAGHADAAACRRYGVLTCVFVATMTAAVLAADLGMLWVAVEATTIVTAFLVAHRRTRSATEAAWKYVVICSVGIAVAFAGVVLLNFAASAAAVPDGLNLASLTRSAAALDPDVTRMAVGLLVLGFGTKAGLTPMHAWLPDAHAQAPAPVSALMSGVLLSVAFYAILRVKTIADAALGIGFTRGLLLIAGLGSLAVAAALLITQRDYKRLLAYSSIEHMGLISVGAAIGGPIAMAAVLLHVLGHGLAKSVLFISSGHIQALFRSHRIAAVSGLAARSPVLGGVFGCGVLALLGMPPFSLFASELGIAASGVDSGLLWAVAVAVALMTVVVAALVRHTGRMLLGAPGPPVDGVTTAGPSPTTVVVLVTGLAACAVLGVTTGPLHGALVDAATVVGGAR